MKPPTVRFDHDGSDQLPGELVEIINARSGQMFELVTYARFGRSLDKTITNTIRGRLAVYPGDPQARHWTRRKDQLRVPGHGWVYASDVVSVTVIDDSELDFFERTDQLLRQVRIADRLADEQGRPAHPDREAVEQEVLAALSLLADIANGTSSV